MAPPLRPRPFRPRAIGEIAIRCADPTRMARFYEEVIGLERLSGEDDAPIIFLKVADGYAGHTAVVALFRFDAGGVAVPAPGGRPATGAGSSLHHLALSMDHAEQEQAMAWYDEIGQPYRVEHFGWIGWRGVFITDPEGNTVELVAYDASELSSKS
ncbi:VOC family protein [Limimaricola pyoseonensis]|uniref:Catechol 2,3-dioxygenase n=1 Tax=Limimaricola pyoseonensis TaxID=521013 RepID=A0A1G7ECL4_9RHOB|nr:VOC family protein [Limimaricola pyoseonensis]SDE61403.1 Catechol 2,3-dioxygenase [Limimaricola pyoseonensis]